LIQNSISQGGSGLIVGDSKQSIYRWRGSDPILLNNKVEADLSSYNIKNINLDKNWRSSKEIINFNNNFFKIASKSIFSSLYNEIVNIKDEYLKDNLLTTLNHSFNVYNDVDQRYPYEELKDKPLVGDFHVEASSIQIYEKLDQLDFSA